MEIKRLSPISGASKAKGLTVIVDVFRAFTTAAYVMANGAKRIYPVCDIEDAFNLKNENPSWILIGERGGTRVKGFDYGNSPFEISHVDFTGKNVIQSTSAGTQGIAKAKGADIVLAGCFVIAEATARYIKRTNPSSVSIVAMGKEGKERSPEDELFGVYLESRLKDERLNFKEIIKTIRSHPEGAKFFDPKQPQFIEEDFNYAIRLDKFDFILKLVKNDLNYLIKA